MSHISGWKQNTTFVIFCLLCVLHVNFTWTTLWRTHIIRIPNKRVWQWHHLQDSCHFKLHSLFIPCSTTSPLVSILTVMKALWKPQDSYKAKTFIEKGQCTHHLVTQTWTVWSNNVCIICSYLTVVRAVVWITRSYLYNILCTVNTQNTSNKMQ